MKVKLKRGWFVEGYRWSRPGEYDIPDRFRDQLPTGAVVVEDSADPETTPEPKPEPIDEGGVKPKGYRLMPKTIQLPGHDPVDSRGALKLAVQDYGKSVAEWNDLDEPERKKRIHTAASTISET